MTKPARGNYHVKVLAAIFCPRIPEEEEAPPPAFLIMRRMLPEIVVETRWIRLLFAWPSGLGYTMSKQSVCRATRLASSCRFQPQTLV